MTYKCKECGARMSDTNWHLHPPKVTEVKTHWSKQVEHPTLAKLSLVQKSFVNAIIQRAIADAFEAQNTKHKAQLAEIRDTMFAVHDKYVALYDEVTPAGPNQNIDLSNDAALAVAVFKEVLAAFDQAVKE